MIAGELITSHVNVHNFNMFFSLVRSAQESRNVVEDGSGAVRFPTMLRDDIGSSLYSQDTMQ